MSPLLPIERHLSIWLNSCQRKQKGLTDVLPCVCVQQKNRPFPGLPPLYGPDWFVPRSTQALKGFWKHCQCKSANFSANSVFSVWSVSRFQTREGHLAEKRSAAKIRYADSLITLKSVSVSVGSVGRCEQGACCRQEMGVWRCVCVSIHNAVAFVRSHTCHWASGTF